MSLLLDLSAKDTTVELVYIYMYVRENSCTFETDS